MTDPMLLWYGVVVGVIVVFGLVPTVFRAVRAEIRAWRIQQEIDQMNQRRKLDAVVRIGR